MMHGNDKSRAGMTAVEIMIVVTIIGILAVIAIPMLRDAGRRSQDVAFANDLRLLSGQVFNYNAFETGGFPPDAPPGVVPPEVANALPRRFHWDRPPSIGGAWDWQRAASRSEKVEGVYYAGIAVVGPGRTTAELAEIDKRIDDGDLNTGLFRSTANGRVMIVEF